MRNNFSGVMKLLLIPVGVHKKVPSPSLADTLPSLAATQPSCQVFMTNVADLFLDLFDVHDDAPFLLLSVLYWIETFLVSVYNQNK